MVPAAYRKELGVGLTVPCNAARVQSAGKRDGEYTNVWTKVRFFVVPINVARHCKITLNIYFRMKK